MENLSQRWTQSSPFFQKSGHFFTIFKKDRGVLPLFPSSAPVSLDEYASISLNLSKYPSKYLNKLF